MQEHWRKFVIRHLGNISKVFPGVKSLRDLARDAATLEPKEIAERLEKNDAVKNMQRAAQLLDLVRDVAKKMEDDPNIDVYLSPADEDDDDGDDNNA